MAICGGDGDDHMRIVMVREMEMEMAMAMVHWPLSSCLPVFVVCACVMVMVV